MDYKAKAEEIVKKIKSDKNIKANFEKDPVKTIDGLIGVDLPDDTINKVIDLVKAKLTADTVSEVAGKISSLFGKKE